jgi:hypothetical protein
VCFFRIYHAASAVFSQFAKKRFHSRVTPRNSPANGNHGALGIDSKAKEVSCGAKTRSGFPCQKPTLQGKTRCRLHGGKSLSGEDHPNYKHGHCTKETRRLTAEGNAYIKYLKTVLIELGLIEMTRK